MRVAAGNGIIIIPGQNDSYNAADILSDYKIPESFERQGVFGEIIKKQQEELSDLRTAYFALSNELEFLKQSAKPKRKSLSEFLNNWYSSLRNEKIKLFIKKVYARLPLKSK